MDQLKWEKIMPGVWNAMDYANPPKIEAIKELGDTPFPFYKGATQYLLNSSPGKCRNTVRRDRKYLWLRIGIKRDKQTWECLYFKSGSLRWSSGIYTRTRTFLRFSKGYGVLINSSQRVKIHDGIGNRKDGKLPQKTEMHWIGVCRAAKFQQNYIPSIRNSPLDKKFPPR